MLAARLRAARAQAAALRAQRDRDVDAIALVRQEVQALSGVRDELGPVQVALADARAALAAVRAERDADRRARQAFLAGLAHDLRNPLAPLANGIELLRLTDGDPAGRLRTRGIMERQVGNLTRMADDLSELARLAGDRATLQDAPLDLAGLLRGLAGRMLPALQGQEMTLVVDAELHDLPPLRGDAERLAQAFDHLVADVVRHAERGSAIRVSAVAGAGIVTLQVATAPDCPGAAPAPGAVHALEDVEVATLGLGVALAEQLVRLHGGHVRAQRGPGTRRARFTVILPLAAAPPPSSIAPPPTSSLDGQPALAVLLADDNVDFSHSFATMLTLLGHRVARVHDGLAAVASIVGSPPDIAFVDLGMPALDGVEAVRRVRGQAHTRQVLLVAMTGRGGAEDRARAAEAGFDRFLVKPFAMQDVRDALDAAQAIRGAGAAAHGS